MLSRDERVSHTMGPHECLHCCRLYFDHANWRNLWSRIAPGRYHSNISDHHVFFYFSIFSELRVQGECRIVNAKQLFNMQKPSNQKWKTWARVGIILWAVGLQEMFEWKSHNLNNFHLVLAHGDIDYTIKLISESCRLICGTFKARTSLKVNSLKLLPPRKRTTKRIHGVSNSNAQPPLNEHIWY